MSRPSMTTATASWKSLSLGLLAFLLLAEVSVAMDLFENDLPSSGLLDSSSFGLPSKRSSVEFMGMHVSYPQYVRLRAIQKEVIKMDQMIRRMVRTHDPQELAANPHWMELLELYDAMKKMLPKEYLRAVGGDNPIPIRRSGGM